MIATPFQSLEEWNDIQPAALVAEGEGALVSVNLGVKKLDGSPLDSQQIQVGQTFQLIVSARDLRNRPEGVFALFNDLNISNSENLQLVVGESQLLELSSNVSGGSFQLGFNGVEAIVTIPSNFSGSDTGKLRQLARNTEIALNNALGANSMSVSLELNAVTPRFVINFRGEYLGTNVPKLNADFANLTATNGQPSGSITDDFLAPEATNSLAFRYSAITFFPDGVLPKAVITSDQPSLISSAGATGD